jgi:outer membrane protein assembly factor BamE (lipoprotein component of BamABCDE complex)
MTVKRTTVTWALIAATSLVLLTSNVGCEVAKLFHFNFKKFTRERYDTIYHGQRRDQVRKKLGKPHQTTGNAWIYSDDKPFCTAAVFFEADKVTAKQWSDFEPIDPRGAKQFRPSQPTTGPK